MEKQLQHNREKMINCRTQPMQPKFIPSKKVKTPNTPTPSLIQKHKHKLN